MKSILENNRDKCFICGSRRNLQEHHVYFGGLRKVSEANGFKVSLCMDCHKGDEGVHFDIVKDYELKRICQAKYEEAHTRQEFMKIIGRNYL